MNSHLSASLSLSDFSSSFCRPFYKLDVDYLWWKIFKDRSFRRLKINSCVLQVIWISILTNVQKFTPTKIHYASEQCIRVTFTFEMQVFNIFDWKLFCHYGYHLHTQKMKDNLQNMLIVLEPLNLNIIMRKCVSFYYFNLSLTINEY